MVTFSLLLTEAWRDFSAIHCENLVDSWKQNSQKCWPPAPSNRVGLEFVTLRHVHAEPPAIHQLQFRSTGSHGDFCLWISAQISCNSLYLPICLSSIGDSTSAYNLTSLIALTRVVDFYSAFYLLSRQSNNFRARSETGNLWLRF